MLQRPCCLQKAAVRVGKHDGHVLSFVLGTVDCIYQMVIEMDFLKDLVSYVQKQNLV